MKIIWLFQNNFVYLHQKTIKLMKPWRVLVDGYFYKDYKRKWAAIRWAKILKDSFQRSVEINVVGHLEIIKI